MPRALTLLYCTARSSSRPLGLLVCVKELSPPPFQPLRADGALGDLLGTPAPPQRDMVSVLYPAMLCAETPSGKTRALGQRAGRPRLLPSKPALLLESQCSRPSSAISLEKTMRPSLLTLVGLDSSNCLTRLVALCSACLLAGNSSILVSPPRSGSGRYGMHQREHSDSVTAYFHWKTGGPPSSGLALPLFFVLRS